jgi:uncharacterized protein YjcR
MKYKDQLNYMTPPVSQCGAKARSGLPCTEAPMPNGRCRVHGGLSPGAPKGNKNAYKHGRYTQEAIEQKAMIDDLLRMADKSLVLI